MPQKFSIQQISKAFQNTIKQLAPAVKQLAAQLGAGREKAAEMAPRVIGAFDKMRAELGRSFTFVNYAQLFDPTVPTHAKERNAVEGYLTHRTYYALDYMRRQQTAKDNPRSNQGVRDNAADTLARVMATLFQVIPEAQHEDIWSQIQKEFTFGERLMTRLKKRVAATKPLIKLETIGKGLKVGNVIHMPKANGEAAKAEPLAQKGRRVKVAA